MANSKGVCEHYLLGMKSSELFPFASFVWLCFNPTSFFRVPGYSNVRTVADNKEIKTPSFGVKHKPAELRTIWTSTSQMENYRKLRFSRSSSSCPRSVRYSTLACLWEQLREFQCMAAVGLRDKLKLYD